MGSLSFNIIYFLSISLARSFSLFTEIIWPEPSHGISFLLPFSGIRQPSWIDPNTVIPTPDGNLHISPFPNNSQNSSIQRCKERSVSSSKTYRGFHDARR